MSMNKLITKVELGGIRGLTGSIELGEGLNIIIGPNNSGKTTLLESIIYSLILNSYDIREYFYYILLLAAARGSQKHSLASLICENKKHAKPCITVKYGVKSVEMCTDIKINSRIESTISEILPVIDIILESSLRECKLTMSISKKRINIRMDSSDRCVSDNIFSENIAIAMIPSGIIPYNYFDTILGKIKRENPELIKKLELIIGDKVYTVDIGLDFWDEAVVMLYEKLDGNLTPRSTFYSIGRGLQRAFQILALLNIYDIVLIDEIESAMHPELLAQIASYISEAVRGGKQVLITTQSLEAASMLASSIINPNLPTGDRATLKEMVNSECGTGIKDKYDNLFSLIIINKHGDEVRSISVKGCRALEYIASIDDPRLSYHLLAPF